MAALPINEHGRRTGTVFIDMAMSLDGFVAGPHGEDRGLYDWYFGPQGNAPLVIDELRHIIRAMILGRRAFGDHRHGFDTPYYVPHFVLTHTPRPPVAHADATFIFVADGIENALAQAAAGEKAVSVARGAATAQRFLQAGLVDELQIHLLSKLLGNGLLLFDQVTRVDLERTRVLESPGVTHRQFRMVK